MSIPVKLALVLAFLFALVTLVSVQIEKNKQLEEQALLAERTEAVRENIAALEYRLNMPFDDSYIRDLARDKLGYCLPEEIIFYNDLIN